MFIDTLFSITQESITETHGEFDIQLHAQHPIYKGHFPNDPITPGVCLVQIVTDLFAHLTGKPCYLTEGKNIKFLQIIKPQEHPIVRYTLDWEAVGEDLFKVKALITAKETSFAKISVTLKTSPRR